MVSIDKVLLLQEKVESAVKVILQLKSENDALRTKCSELTNALSGKTELLSTFQADEKKIEDGILQALDRLNTVENSVLKSADNQVQVKQNITEPSESSEVTEEQQTDQETSNGQFDIF
jgi:chromosome segregation ATPase